MCCSVLFVLCWFDVGCVLLFVCWLVGCSLVVFGVCRLLFVVWRSSFVVCCLCVHVRSVLLVDWLLLCVDVLCCSLGVCGCSLSVFLFVFVVGFVSYLFLACSRFCFC